MTIRIKKYNEDERYESPDLISINVNNDIVILDWLIEKIRAEIPLNEIEYIIVI